MLIAAIMARSLLMSQKRLIFFLNLTVIVLQVSEASSLSVQLALKIRLAVGQLSLT